MHRTTLFATAGMLLTVVIAGSWLAFDNEREHSAASDTRRAPEQVSDVSGTVWVANEGSSSLTGFDASTGTIVAKVEGIASPHNVQSMGRQTLLAVSGDSMVHAVRSDTMRAIASAPTGDHPAHVVASPDGSRVYVSNSGDDTVSTYDARLRARGTIAVGDFPHGLRPSPDGRWLLVANMGDTTVSLIDAKAGKVRATIEVGNAPVQTAFHPDGRSAYVALNADDEIVRIDLATRAVVARQKVDPGPVQSYVTPDGARIVVASQGTEAKPSSTIAVLDAQTLRSIDTIETGDGAHGVVIDPSSRYAYVTNIYAGTTSIVDLAELRVIRSVRTGKQPNGVTFSSHEHMRGMPDRMDLAAGAQAGHGHAGGGDH